jgi:DNA polymerase-3 subunit alpha
MIAYRTAYLKAHYPTEFMSALLNSESSDIERISFLIGECKKMNVQVLPPDINKSAQKFAPEGNNIRFGLDAIKNVGSNIVAAIIETRERGGDFANFSDLLSRVQHKDLNKKSLDSLTKCGALDSFGTERNTIIQNLDEITKFAQAARKSSPANQSTGLFGASFVSTAAPKALQLKPAEPATKKDKLAWEKELLGLYVSDHPLTVANENGAVTALKPTRIKDMLVEKSAIKSYRICGMVASVKSIITKTGKPMCFAKVEDQSGSVEVVVFSDTYTKYQTCWKDGAILVIVGKLNFRNGETSLLADQVKEIV